MSYDWWAILYPAIFDRREEVLEALQANPMEWQGVKELRDRTGLRSIQVRVSLGRLIRDEYVARRTPDDTPGPRWSRFHRRTFCVSVHGVGVRVQDLRPWFPMPHQS